MGSNRSNIRIVLTLLLCAPFCIGLLVGMFTVVSDEATEVSNISSVHSETTNNIDSIPTIKEEETEQYIDSFDYKYDGKYRKVKVTDTAEFRQCCVDYDYDKLEKSPDIFVDTPITTILLVDSELGNSPNYYISSNSNGVYIVLNRIKDRIYPEDVVTVYGIYRGNMEIYNSDNEVFDVPLIEAVTFDHESEQEGEN